MMAANTEEGSKNSKGIKVRRPSNNQGVLITWRETGVTRWSSCLLFKFRVPSSRCFFITGGCAQAKRVAYKNRPDRAMFQSVVSAPRPRPEPR